MKNKSKEKPKEQKEAEVRNSELSDSFYGLLDKLLPLGKKSFLEVLEEKQKHLVNIRDKEKDDLKYALEFEKAINSGWKEYANILFAQYQRVSADYANFQKRVPKQITDTICYEKERFIKTLLPALDNFESALGGLRDAHSAENTDVLIKGVRIIYDQMLDILKSHGVEQIKALGEKFDPALHEAMTQKVEPEQEENIVLEEFQKGYKLNGRVIRPTKVIVNKLQSEQTAQQQMPTEEKPQQQAQSPEKITDKYEKNDTE